MITQEREIPAETIKFKALRLIAPEKARQLDIPAEAPVFVSPVALNGAECDECEIVYKPLVYQVGRKVEAHHFHEKTGGIYQYYRFPVLKGEANLNTPGYRGWFAETDPIGAVRKEILGQGLRSEAVRIIKIRAYCADAYCKQEITEGVVVSQAGTDLSPLCSLEKHPKCTLYARYVFKITEDGEVLFSQIDENEEGKKTGAI